MNKSRIIQQPRIYLQYDSQGNTKLTSLNSNQFGIGHRRIHYTYENIDRNQSDLFIDPNFRINESELVNLDSSNRRIILKRLSQIYRLYPNSEKPKFFPPKGYIPPKKLSSDPYLPAFISELGIFPVQHFKSFFITQDFQQNGLYQVIVNHNGRFQNDIVDDIIPVFQNSFEPIWGMQLDQAWKIIILKVWAKKNGGYSQVKNSPPFNFIQQFSDSNWKYYNLQKEAYDFLSFYTGKTNVGKFVLKTKNSDKVKEAGLIPGSAGYQMINLIQTTPNRQQNTKVDPRDRKWIATIKSTMINKWAGHLSILDKQINNRYQPNQHPMALDRDFMINEADFINLFSSVYICSKRGNQDKKCSSYYYLLNVQPNIKTSIYLKFRIEKDGQFDFCVKQFQQNKIQPTNKSVIRIEQHNKNQGISDGLRYLKCKFIVVKQNNQQSISTFTDPDYFPPAYDTYQIQYLQGYNRGDARFLNVVRGDYILKIKPQSVNKPSIFVVNYASELPIKMVQYFPEKRETSLIMRQSMASLIGLLTSYHLNTDRKDEEITFANVFEQIGYGFIGIRSKKTCLYNILLQVDPKQLFTSGYKVKNQFKRINEPFSILIHPGQCTSVVLKKIPNAKYEWPPRGVQIFRQK